MPETMKLTTGFSGGASAINEMSPGPALPSHKCAASAFRNASRDPCQYGSRPPVRVQAADEWRAFLKFGQAANGSPEIQ